MSNNNNNNNNDHDNEIIYEDIMISSSLVLDSVGDEWVMSQFTVCVVLWCTIVVY